MRRGTTMILVYLLGLFLVCSLGSPVESESDDEKNLPSTPLDPTTIRAKRLLGNLQGNILQDHGRPFARHVFIQFGDDHWKSRLFVVLLSRGVTSALEQLDPERKGLFRSVRLPEAESQRRKDTGKGPRTMHHQNNLVRQFLCD